MEERGEDDEDLVADIVPEPVVIVLEVVDIEEGDDAVLIEGQCLGEDRLEALSVPETCEDIGEAHLEEPLLLAVVDELRGDEVSRELYYETVILVEPHVAPCGKKHHGAYGTLDIEELNPYDRRKPAARGLHIVEHILPPVMPHDARDSVNLAEDFLLDLRRVRLAVPGAGGSALRRLAEKHRAGLEVEEEAQSPEALDRYVLAVIRACREALQAGAEPHAAYLPAHGVNASLMADHDDCLIEEHRRYGAAGVLHPVGREIVVPGALDKGLLDREAVRVADLHGLARMGESMLSVTPATEDHRRDVVVDEIRLNGKLSMAAVDLACHL